MRGVVWLVLLFTVAVVTALGLGDNDGLVSIYWSGRRIDMSLNFFVLAALVCGFALLTLVRTLDALVSLPRRAAAWRESRREMAAQAALREAMAEFFAGRYSRADKAARRALNNHQGTQAPAGDAQFRVLALLLSAASAHRLQDRTRRDEALSAALDAARESGGAQAVQDGARLLGAEWALDDQDALRAESLLAELPAGVARRTQALRLKLKAARLRGQSAAGLHMARLLAKHQAFSPSAARSLLRSLAIEVIGSARDLDQLRQGWQQFESSDRRDAFVVARAAERAVALGSAEEARAWLKPLWDEFARYAPEERAALALALIAAAEGIAADWLPRLEALQQGYRSDGAVQAAAGVVFAQRGLWGKARRPLESAAQDASLDARVRRSAWRQLAQLARKEGDEERAARCDQAAAAID